MQIAQNAEREMENEFKKINLIKEHNQLKVLYAMKKNKLSDTHFAGTTGYGYDDVGRDVLDSVFADVFGAEDALVRHNIVSGTHALALCLFGVLRPGDELLSITGKPYDTLEEVIGIRGSGGGSLKELGVSYRQVDLAFDGSLDFASIEKAINKNTRLVYIQRSRGYTQRPALFVKDIKEAVEYVKKIKNDIIILVDNCYGEFVEEEEPLDVGVDLIAGSLIKNPGGGIAPCGGYVAGKSTYVKMAAYRLTTPGLGKKVGASLGMNRNFFQGLFLAPHVVAESLKGVVFSSAFMTKMGLNTFPKPFEKRGDIIQAIQFGSSDKLIAFCQEIQKNSPVDAFALPVPWDMPGYDASIIMAAGTFVQGASIELSADAPIKPPYIAYLQGGLVYEHVKLAVIKAFEAQKKIGRIYGEA